MGKVNLSSVLQVTALQLLKSCVHGCISKILICTTFQVFRPFQQIENKIHYNFLGACDTHKPTEALE